MKVYGQATFEGCLGLCPIRQTHPTMIQFSLFIQPLPILMSLI